MLKSFPEVKEREEMRKIIGRYGLTGRQQVRSRFKTLKIIFLLTFSQLFKVCPIRQLSDGQRCRVVFAYLAWQVPHLLLMDEPTNHLDMETIDALVRRKKFKNLKLKFNLKFLQADAINDFDGGMVLVSHDFRLINQVAEEIWICEKGTVTKWKGNILDYKDYLKKRIVKETK